MLAIVLIVFFAPIVPVNSNNFNFGQFSSNQQTYASVSYVMFKCGEVHSSGSATYGSNNLASSDQYKWVCGQ